MDDRRRPAPLSGLQRIALGLLPVAFVAALAGAFRFLLWPRIVEGHALAVVIGCLVGVALVCAAAAAVVFLRDLASGRYPASARGEER